MINKKLSNTNRDKKSKKVEVTHQKVQEKQL